MRIQCLITVCAFLLSTVSSDENQYLNRLKRTRVREESIVDDATARKELNPKPEIRPDVFSTLRKPRSQGQIETFHKPLQSQTKSQHPRDHSRRQMKRLKVRSVVGSTFEVDDNNVPEIIHESIPEVHEADQGPIYIKPVFRVTHKRNIFDSIMDILNQLLDPPKKELGPVVGPIEMPGSKRKLYLRLVEPVDSSHINVRFVTQIPVPVVKEEPREHESILPFLPFVDPTAALLNRPHGDDASISSSNRHHTVQLPRNASHVPGKDRGKPKLKRPSENLKETVKVEAPASGVENDKNQFYYQYQLADDAVKPVTEIVQDVPENEQGLMGSLVEPWYQLSTHRLPLRQIAPLYPLTGIEPQTDSSSYENTYKVPSDSLTVPSPHSSDTYEQYSNVKAAPGLYEQSYAIPNAYSTTYQKQNEFSDVPIPYQTQNEFNNAPSSTSYVKQNDLFSAPTTYTSSYEKPANVPPPPSSPREVKNGVQTGSSSQSALHVVEPPSVNFPRNHANKAFKHTTIRQHLNLSNVNEMGSLPRNTAQNGKLPTDQVTWGKIKREKGEPNFQKSAEITLDDNREHWQPLVSEDVDWHKAFTNLAKIVQADNHREITARPPQSVNRPRQVSQSTTPSTIEIGRVNQRQNVKSRNPTVATTRDLKCSPTDKGNRCERTGSAIVSTPHPQGAIKIAERQTQSAANVESILITPRSIASDTVDTLDVPAKDSWIEGPQPLVMLSENLGMSSTTERSPLLIKVVKNTVEKSVESKTTNRSTSDSTEKSIRSGTSEASVRSKARPQLPKRPVVMKKSSSVLKEPSSPARRTVASNTTRKPTASGTTERTRRSKHGGAVSKIKSSTT